MKCPNCGELIKGNIKECPSCFLSLYMVNSLLSPPPQTNPGLNDFLKILKPSDAKKVNHAIKSLSRKFRQVELHIMIKRFTGKFPFGSHLFWLLNCGNFCEPKQRGNKNHTILLGLDPESGKVGITVGYGLESFLTKKMLNSPLKKAQSFLAKGDFTEAILTIITELEEVMKQACLTAKSSPALT